MRARSRGSTVILPSKFLLRGAVHAAAQTSSTRSSSVERSQLFLYTECAQQRPPPRAGRCMGSGLGRSVHKAHRHAIQSALRQFGRPHGRRPADRGSRGRRGRGGLAIKAVPHALRHRQRQQQCPRPCRFSHRGAYHQGLAIERATISMRAPKIVPK